MGFFWRSADEFSGDFTESTDYDGNQRGKETLTAKFKFQNNKFR